MRTDSGEKDCYSAPPENRFLSSNLMEIGNSYLDNLRVGGPFFWRTTVFNQNLELKQIKNHCWFILFTIDGLWNCLLCQSYQNKIYKNKFKKSCHMKMIWAGSRSWEKMMVKLKTNPPMRNPNKSRSPYVAIAVHFLFVFSSGPLSMIEHCKHK